MKIKLRVIVCLFRIFAVELPVLGGGKAGVLFEELGEAGGVFYAD